MGSIGQLRIQPPFSRPVASQFPGPEVTVRIYAPGAGPQEEAFKCRDLARTFRSCAVLVLQLSQLNEILRDLLRPRYRRLFCGR